MTMSSLQKESAFEVKKKNGQDQKWCAMNTFGLNIRTLSVWTSVKEI